jgi:hypothetical protein
MGQNEDSVASLLAESASCSPFSPLPFFREADFVSLLSYRTNIFGFLASSDLSEQDSDGLSGNYGLYDCVAMLEWVRLLPCLLSLLRLTQTRIFPLTGPEEHRFLRW